MQRRKKKPRTASLQHEYTFHSQGYRTIIGLDEAGYGAWAGPVYAGAVCLPAPDESLLETLAGVRDSKEMTRLQRERLSIVIKETALAWGVGYAERQEIDRIGIRPAVHLAMTRAIDEIERNFALQPDLLLLDGMRFKQPLRNCEERHYIRGDKESLSIAASSVLAKTTRDAFMTTLDETYPAYGFGRHKGYGTAQHREALAQHGPCSQHRTTYRPIAALLSQERS